MLIYGISKKMLNPRGSESKLQGGDGNVSWLMCVSCTLGVLQSDLLALQTCSVCLVENRWKRIWSVSIKGFCPIYHISQVMWIVPSMLKFSQLQEYTSIDNAVFRAWYFPHASVCVAWKHCGHFPKPCPLQIQIMHNMIHTSQSCEQRMMIQHVLAEADLKKTLLAPCSPLSRRVDIVNVDSVWAPTDLIGGCLASDVAEVCISERELGCIDQVVSIPVLHIGIPSIRQVMQCGTPLLVFIISSKCVCGYALCLFPFTPCCRVKT